jgi:hypothetical protein
MVVVVVVVVDKRRGCGEGRRKGGEKMGRRQAIQRRG